MIFSNTRIFREAMLDDITSLIDLRKLLLNNGTGHYVARTHEEQVAWIDSYHLWLMSNIAKKSDIKIIVSCLNEAPHEIHGCAIGIIDERVPYSGCLNGRMGWVQTVVVHPDYRCQGVAKHMMDYLFHWFINNSVEKVTLQTTEIAKKLYLDMGFFDSEEPLLIKTLAKGCHL